MQFGLFGSATARRPTSAEAGEFDSSEGFRDFIEYNVEAEGLGFRGTFVVEHHFTGYGQVSATLNLLTWLGARTTTLRLGTAVIVLPWHNPVLLAEQAATLDLLSGGRLDFGVGSGYRYNEFAGFRVPMDEANARFGECLDVIVKAWTSNEKFSHRGHYWQFDNIVVEPPTAQKPHPPIWMGAGGESSVRRVAAAGHNLLLGQYASPADVGRSIAAVPGRRRGERTAFRPALGRRHPRLLCLRHEGGKGGRAAAPPGKPGAPIEAGDAARRHRPWRPRPRHRRPRHRQPHQRDVRHPDDIAEKLDELRRAGVGYVLINGGGSGGGERGRASLRRFAAEVMPHFLTAMPELPAARQAAE